MRSTSDGAVHERSAKRYREASPAGVAEPPRASLAGGAAGIAYFLMRHATWTGDRGSLEASVAWARQAESAAAEDLPETSIQYGSAGAHWVAALVGAAAGEDELFGRSLTRYGEIVRSAIGAPGDVTHGSAGLLLGSAQLITMLGEVDDLRAAGDVLASDLADLALREGAVPHETTLEYLGVAHGWAGVAHSLLWWSQATGSPPAPAALELLERLTALRRPSGRWPIRAGSREVYRGWCHGSAGWAQVWALAAAASGEERFLAIATECAQDAADAHDEPNASLCCGRAGQGFAVLTLYRATGDRRWLEAARMIAGEAADGATEGEPAHRLFTGGLGAALLALELEDPGRSAMPYFEPIA